MPSRASLMSSSARRYPTPDPADMSRTTAFYTPDKDREGLHPAKAQREDLPHALILGDSISIGYTGQVRDRLQDICNIHRPEDNCGDTWYGLTKIDEWLGTRTWDVIHFNWGLHDLCYRHPESKVYGNRDKIRGHISVEPDAYAHHLEELTSIIQRRTRALVWASITFIPEHEAGRFQCDDQRYNRIANGIMQARSIPINDLHTLTRRFPSRMFVRAGDVHFTDEAYGLIADAVSAHIRAALRR